MRRTLLACAFVALAAAAVPAADWPQFDLNPRHSGASSDETMIGVANVSTLHLAFPPVSLPAIADGAPAFLTGVTTPHGVKDLLFLTTKSGTLLAFDGRSGALVWSRSFGNGPNYTTSSPAVDPDRNFVYTYGLDGRVHKVRVGDGEEVTTGGWPELATLKPDVEKGSSALTVARVGGVAYLWVTNGGYLGDRGDYQGHVTAIELGSGRQRIFNADCSDLACHLVEHGGDGCDGPHPDCSHVQSAIWGRSGVVFDADTDRIYMATGNGTFDAASGGFDWGDSVFALHPDGSGDGHGWPLDSYTPPDYQSLDDADLDLGSTAPAILPAPAGSTIAHLAVQGGKDGKLRLLDLDDLSGQGGPGHVGGALQVIEVPQGGEVLTAPAVWVNPADGATWVFVANGAGISGLKLGLDDGGAPRLQTASPSWTNRVGGTSPVVANAILYDASYSGMRALDPTTGATLWQDSHLGPVHWESPIVVNGRVYVTDESAHLLVYEPVAPRPRVRRRVPLPGGR
jgi:outer membrane protein assembly factor BamB